MILTFWLCVYVYVSKEKGIEEHFEIISIDELMEDEVSEESVNFFPVHHGFDWQMYYFGYYKKTNKCGGRK